MSSVCLCRLFVCVVCLSVSSVCLLSVCLLSVCLCVLGVRDQPLDWQTAPPVHVLTYLVLGGKKDAMSKEVCVCVCVGR